MLFHTFPLIVGCRCIWSHDPNGASPTGLGCSAFARRYLRNHCCFLFLQVLRWFTSLGWLVLPYEFRQSYIGFPHSDIDGSMDKCSSPSLFAAFHVLHRLQVPRHSPHALSSLTIKLVHQQIFLHELFDLSSGITGLDRVQIKPVEQMIITCFTYNLFFATCRFFYMYSVVKHQVSSTTVENKTFS